MLIVMTGLPGTGKSAIAQGIAQALVAPVFSVDPLEAELIKLGITREHRSDLAAYKLLEALAASQLLLGQSAILDAVNPFQWIRRQWRELAEKNNTPIAFVATVCSDVEVHRSRIEGRGRNLDCFTYEPIWDDVVASMDEYELFTEAAGITLDAVNPLDSNIAEAVAYVTTSPRATA